MTGATARPDPGDDDALFARRAQDPSARAALAERFSPLAAYLARRFSGRGEPIEDLVQVANLGLLAAIDRFDADRGVQFSTFAAATIVGELKRHLRDRTWAVRVPRRLQEDGLEVNRAIPELTQELGRSPTIDELAGRVAMEPDRVLEALDAMRAYDTVSLDTSPGDDETPGWDLVGSEDASLERSEAWATIAPAVASLPAREQRVLYLRFFAGMTQSEIAAEIGVSQMHVSRILAQTLRQLRDEVGDASEP